MRKKWTFIVILLVSVSSVYFILIINNNVFQSDWEAVHQKEVQHHIDGAVIGSAVIDYFENENVFPTSLEQLTRYDFPDEWEMSKLNEWDYIKPKSKINIENWKILKSKKEKLTYILTYTNKGAILQHSYD